jgi:hypothetical protein
MTLVAIDYTAADNCSGVTTALFISGRGADDRADVVDAHHVLVKGGHGRGNDDGDERRPLTLTIEATDETGNSSQRSVTVGGRSKER